MRRFLPVGGGGGGGVEPSSSSTTPQRGEAEAAGLRFGGGDISLGPHGGGGGGGGGHGHQLQDGSVDLLARHSSSPAGFFSNLIASNGKIDRSIALANPLFDFICSSVFNLASRACIASPSCIGV